jgi:hypothetical protein
MKLVFDPSNFRKPHPQGLARYYSYRDRDLHTDYMEQKQNPPTFCLQHAKKTGVWWYMYYLVSTFKYKTQATKVTLLLHTWNPLQQHKSSNTATTQ